MKLGQTSLQFRLHKEVSWEESRVSSQATGESHQGGAEVALLSQKVCLWGLGSLGFTVWLSRMGFALLPLPLLWGSPSGIWPQAEAQSS